MVAVGRLRNGIKSKIVADTSRPEPKEGEVSSAYTPHATAGGTYPRTPAAEIFKLRTSDRTLFTRTQDQPHPTATVAAPAVPVAPAVVTITILLDGDSPSTGAVVVGVALASDALDASPVVVGARILWSRHAS